jgi:hypothetical protein
MANFWEKDKEEKRVEKREKKQFKPLEGDRFTLLQKDSFSPLEESWVIVDKQTGCQYLYIHYGESSGLTLLVDRDGKPLLAN